MDVYQLHPNVRRKRANQSQPEMAHSEGDVIRVVIHAEVIRTSGAQYVCKAPGHPEYRFLVRPEDITDADGVMVQKPICEYCLEEYTPSGTGQRFCCPKHKSLWHYYENSKRGEDGV